MTTAAGIDLAGGEMLAVSRGALSALRSALLRDAGPEAATCLQEAGYAGGRAVFASFERWLRSQGVEDPAELPMDDFQRRASTYFRDAGWGTVELDTLHDAVAVVDSRDWGEADPHDHLEHPACHFTTGMFADFFGHFSDVPLAVLEVECRSTGAPRCRFLLGNGDVMRYVYDEMERGAGYEEAVGRVE
ncbi:MAG TPA: V4R domain-containing protein, partial [Gemmatimonadaceae bacterium]|nr:V4R domain-containing protein [Gemmatimonadaceae bacterium]